MQNGIIDECRMIKIHKCILSGATSSGISLYELYKFIGDFSVEFQDWAATQIKNHSLRNAIDYRKTIIFKRDDDAPLALSRINVIHDFLVSPRAAFFVFKPYRDKKVGAKITSGDDQRSLIAKDISEKITISGKIIGGNVVKSVSLRDIYNFMLINNGIHDSVSNFSKWIQYIRRYICKLNNNIDCLEIMLREPKSRYGHALRDYYVPLSIGRDTVSETEYFPDQLKIIVINYIDGHISDKFIAEQTIVEETTTEPDHEADIKFPIDLYKLAKIFGLSSIHTFYKMLRHWGVMRYGPRDSTIPTPAYMDKGYFLVINQPYSKDKLSKAIYRTKTVVTESGFCFLKKFTEKARERGQITSEGRFVEPSEEECL